MIIGISGKMGVGKDLSAKILQQLIFESQHETHSIDTFKIKRFAGKLKFIVSLLTGVPINDLERQEIKESSLGGEWNYVSSFNTVKSYTVREMLQRVGTDAMRNQIHQDVWVNALFADYRPGDDWIIPDVRFRNEAEAVKSRGGILIRVERSNLQGLFTEEHPSEKELDDYKGFDYRVDNNGTIEDLTEKLKIILKQIGL